MEIVQFNLIFFPVPSRLDAEWFRKIKFVLIASRGIDPALHGLDGKSVVQEWLLGGSGNTRG